MSQFALVSHFYSCNVVSGIFAHARHYLEGGATLREAFIGQADL